MANCSLVFLFFLLSVTTHVESKNEADVEPYAELKELRQKLQQMESENHQCRTKYAALRQRTRGARSLSEHADTCNVKLYSCKERLGMWLELGRNFTTRESACSAAIQFAGRFLLKKAGLDFNLP